MDIAHFASTELGYWIGATGGAMLLLILLYPIRKHQIVTFGKMKYWFNIHLFFGITAPILIIIHTGAEFLSINAKVAFAAMMIVFFSGIVGRYIKRKFSVKALEHWHMFHVPFLVLMYLSGLFHVYAVHAY